MLVVGSRDHGVSILDVDACLLRVPANGEPIRDPLIGDRGAVDGANPLPHQHEVCVFSVEPRASRQPGLAHATRADLLRGDADALERAQESDAEAEMRQRIGADLGLDVDDADAPLPKVVQIGGGSDDECPTLVAPCEPPDLNVLPPPASPADDAPTRSGGGRPAGIIGPKPTKRISRRPVPIRPQALSSPQWNKSARPRKADVGAIVSGLVGSSRRRRSSSRADRSGGGTAKQGSSAPRPPLKLKLGNGFGSGRRGKKTNTETTAKMTDTKKKKKKKRFTLSSLGAAFESV